VIKAPRTAKDFPKAARTWALRIAADPRLFETAEAHLLRVTAAGNLRQTQFWRKVLGAYALHIERRADKAPRAISRQASKAWDYFTGVPPEKNPDVPF